MKLILVFYFLSNLTHAFGFEFNPEISLVVSSWKYSEPEIHPGVSISDSGPLMGTSLNLNDMFSNDGLSFGLESTFLFISNTTYKGFSSNKSGELLPLESSTENRIFSVYGNLDFQIFPLGKSSTGIGFRRLKDFDQEDVSGDYTRIQDYLTLHIGQTFQFTEDFSLKIEIHQLLLGKHKAFLNGENFEPASLTQSFGSGFGVKGNFRYNLHPIFFKLGFEGWKVGDSNFDEIDIEGFGFSRVYEPANNTIMLNLAIGYTF